MNCICPYHKSHGKHFISCQRGLSKARYRGDLKIHISQSCNGKYRDCKTYQYLERSWGHAKESTAN